MTTTYHSNGKLLLTGEYLVLDGATALAVPTKKGQSLMVEEVLHKEHIAWKSLNSDGYCWFEATINPTDFSFSSTDEKVGNQLIEILKCARNQNANFLKNTSGLNVKTTLDFPKDWGLGTSSTLINNIAQWAQVNAFDLLRQSFGGSGYDIAAAQHNCPIFYKRKKEGQKVKEIALDWDFKNQLYFVYLNQKQDSKKGIEQYKHVQKSDEYSKQISVLSKKMLFCDSIEAFEHLISIHEQVISHLLKLQPVKQRLFKEYPRAMKSLGAWGGDFMLVVGTQNEITYFRQKGYTTIIPFQEMVK